MHKEIKLDLDSFLLSETDEKVIIRYANDEFCEFAEYTLEELIGNVPTYSPQKEIDLKAEYLYKDIKFISKVTYVGSRYSDNVNSDKLNSYAIGSLGAIFFTKIDDEDVKIDLSIRNILNKDYYIYSDTKGDSTNFMMNMSMQF